MSTSPAIKATWLIILALFLIGLGLAGTGLALGGKFPSSITSGGIEFVDLRTGTVFDRHMEERRPSVTGTSGNAFQGIDFHTIDIEAPVADIKLLPTDADYLSYTIRARDVLRYQVSVQDGEFTIEVNDRYPRIGITRFPITESQGNFDEIVVEIPRTMNFTEITLQSVAGSIDVIENLNTQNLDIESVVGAITIQGIGHDVSQGTILNLATAGGRINVADAHLQNFKLELVGGFAQVYVRNLADFHVTANAVGGTVTKDGQNVVAAGLGQGQAGTPGGINQISIDIVGGSVDLLSAPLPNAEAGGATPEPTPADTPEVPPAPEAPAETPPASGEQPNIGQGPPIPGNITPRAPRALGGPTSPPISAQRAVEIAAQHLGSIGINDARFDYVYMDRENGIWVWSVEFDHGRLSYEFYIDLNTGNILEFTSED